MPAPIQAGTKTTMTDRITMENHRRNHEGGWQLFQDPALRDSWGDCKKRAMVPDISAPYLCGEQEFFSIKEKTKKLYAYSNRLINSIYHWSVRPLAYVMVDGHGFILKLYCGEEIRGWLEERGIRERCSLSEEHAGTTAFSLGIKYKRPFRTTGSEHYLSKFIDMTMYFAPCVLEDNSRERFGELELLGGIGIITPRTDRFEDYLATVITMCKEVCLHLDMVNTFYNFYMSETMGYICVDIDERTRRPYCLYHNSNIFNVLGIPFSDLCFKSLSTVFDPLPANREFWQVLSSNEYLHNASISLSIQGVTRQYIVSTMPYRQVSVGYEGMRFFISNKEQVSSFVSRQIGNNAIMTFGNIIGQSREIKQSIRYARKYAEFDNNVLIMGESGVGKDIFAQAIHNASSRRDRPFIAVNCATFPRDLMVSELFGYEQGAFTGSKKNGNTGKLELANTGTLFLDEIGTLPLDLQAILLRVLETKRFMKLGASKETSVDVRIIAATNADILEMVSQKSFRGDLYFRLSAFVLNIPPLRKRREDVVLLANHFISRVARRIHITPPQIADDAVIYLSQLPWKGNVRELQNLMEGIVQIYSPSVITVNHITDYLNVIGAVQHPASELEEDAEPKAASPQPDDTSSLTRDAILHALKECRGNKSRAAEYLGVSRKTLYKWMRRLQVLG